MQPDFFKETFHFFHKRWGFLIILILAIITIFFGEPNQTHNFKYAVMAGLVIYLIMGLVRFFGKNTAYEYRERKNTKQQQNEWRKRTDAEEKTHQLAIRREREVLQARAEVQISTMERLHAQNVSVERQLMELRKELQTIENDENKAFMEEMIKQAERSLKG